MLRWPVRVLIAADGLEAPVTLTWWGPSVLGTLCIRLTRSTLLVRSVFLIWMRLVRVNPCLNVWAVTLWRRQAWFLLLVVPRVVMTMVLLCILIDRLLVVKLVMVTET